jgi:hypothetical protein
MTDAARDWITRPTAPGDRIAAVLGRCQGVDSVRADIDRTIAMWDRTGVDYCDVWWAMGRRTPCNGGWPAVRAAMIRWTVRHSPVRLAA